MASAGLVKAQGALAGHSIVGPRFADALQTHRSCLQLPAPIGCSTFSQGVLCRAAPADDKRAFTGSDDNQGARRQRMWLRPQGRVRRAAWVTAAQAAEQAHSDAADRSKRENRAHLMAHREETHEMEELERPLGKVSKFPLNFISRSCLREFQAT